MTAGPTTLTITFLSPIIPSDLVLHSLPFSYLTISVKSNDGKAHSVQVYSDISAEWVSGDSTLTATWSTDSSTNGLVTHKVQLENPQVYTEHNDHTQCESFLPSFLPLRLSFIRVLMCEGDRWICLLCYHQRMCSLSTF